MYTSSTATTLTGHAQYISYGSGLYIILGYNEGEEDVCLER